MIHHITLSTLILLIALPAAGQFFIGSSPNPVGSGARALGQGNAFIAIADDATAATWNPGGLSQLQRPEFSFALEAVRQYEHLNARDIHREVESSETIDFEEFNFISLVLPVYALDRNMVFSLNYLQLYHFDKSLKFPFVESQDNPFPDILKLTQESNIDFRQSGTFSVIAPSFGINVTSKLALGVTFNIWNHAMTDSSRYVKTNDIRGRTIFDELPPLPDTIIPTQFNGIEVFEVDEAYSWVLGGIYRRSKAWTFAAVFKPEFSMHIDHIEEDTFTPRTKTNATLEQPMILGAGAAWRPSDPLTLSMDATWTQWSRHLFKEKTFDSGVGAVVNLETNPISGKKEKLDDTFTFRLGSEYLWIYDNYIVPLRCGIGYDPGPSVKEVDDFYTVSLGVGLQAGRFMWDFAYEYRWGNDVNGAIINAIDVTQDVRRHRVLASLIYYF